MHTRKYQAQDKDKLIALWKEIFPDDPPHNEPASVLNAKLLVDDLIFVVEDQAGLIGACMVGYDGHRGWLYSVGVLKSARRVGAGSALVNHAIASLKELGCIKINLQVRPDNTGVATFYESMGFSTEERLSMGVMI